MRTLAISGAICGLLVLSCCGGPARAQPPHVISGAVPKDKGPDGNTVILDAPGGLIVFDTGRHPEHAQAIIAYARQKKRPIAAIVNSHWHLDHTTGNWDIRQAYPRVAVYASNALEGALATFLEGAVQEHLGLEPDRERETALARELVAWYSRSGHSAT